MICYVYAASFYMFETKNTLLQLFKSISQPDNRIIYDNGPTNPPTTYILGPKYMETDVYQRSPTQVSKA